MQHKSSLEMVTLFQDSELLAKLSNLFFSWNQVEMRGFNWTPEKVFQEMKQLSNSALINPEIQVLVLFQQIPPEAEIHLVFKNKRADSKQVRDTLIATINANSQIKTWWLEVHCLNFAAKKLYEEIGFYLVSNRNNYYLDGADALIYRKDRDKPIKS